MYSTADCAGEMVGFGLAVHACSALSARPGILLGTLLVFHFKPTKKYMYVPPRNTRTLLMYTGCVLPPGESR